jgi:hypothetical protein
MEVRPDIFVSFKSILKNFDREAQAEAVRAVRLYIEVSSNAQEYFFTEVLSDRVGACWFANGRKDRLSRSICAETCVIAVDFGSSNCCSLRLHRWNPSIGPRREESRKQRMRERRGVSR